MDRVNKRAGISIVLCIAIGLLTDNVTDVGLVLSIILPAACFMQLRRSHAFFASLGYYAAASSIVIPGARTFFGPNTGFGDIIALWMLASTLLALPYAVLWSDRCESASWWRAPLSVIVSIPPPLGIIGWANPLTAAGILFPGTAWFGLVLALAFIAVSPVRPREACSSLAIIAIISNLLYPGTPPPPARWEGVNTTFGGLGLESSSPVAEFSAAEAIQQRAMESHAQVIVFPETIVPRWSLATDLFWEQTVKSLASARKTILVGAGVDIPGTRKYRNAVIARGNDNGVFLQHIPVPVGMWRPFTNRGVPMELAGTGIMSVAGERVVILICYEQFLTWPLLRCVGFGPSLLIGISNDYWSRETRIPDVQVNLLRVWARLFSIPFLSAVNT